MLDRSLDRLFWGTGAAAVIMMLLLAAFISIQVFARCVLAINVVGLFDLSIYTLIIFPFITAAYTLRKAQHVCVDVLTSRLPEKARIGLDIPVMLLSMVFIVVLGLQAARWAYKSFSADSMTIGAIAIPKGILISIMTVGCFLLILQVVRMIVHDIQLLASRSPSKTGHSRSRDNSYVYAALFVIGIILGVVLLRSGNPIVGLVAIALVCIFSGMPVFLALGIIGCFGLYFMLGPSGLMQVPITAYKSMDSFPLTCLPLFILGGLIMERGKIAHDLFRLFELWIGKFGPSLLIAAMMVGGVFCAISGSSVGTTAVMAGVALPILISRGYSKGLSCGAVAVSTIGTLIPPSIGYVIYGVFTGESIAQLFMAGLIPGAIIFGLSFAYVIFLGIVRKSSLFEERKIPDRILERTTWTERFSALKKGGWGLLAPVIVLGGIYMGFFTPTEAAGVLVVYAIIICVSVTKTLKWSDLLTTTEKNVQISSMLLCIIIGAYIFALVISQLQIADRWVSFAERTGFTANAVLLLIFFTLFIFGMFLDAASCKVITLPVFYPLAMAVGINSLWLGVFYQIILEIGLLTPPIGLNLFAISGVSGIPFSKVVTGTLPFLLLMILSLLIIFCFPQVVTWLPKTMG